MIGATTTAPTPLIAWHTLGQILWISLVAGVAIVTLMAVGVQALSLSRRDGSATVRSVYQVVVLLSGLAILALIGWGLYLIVHKS